MTFVHGRSPLGYLRRLRGAVIAIPILTFVSLSVAGSRYENGAVVDPVNGVLVQPILVPLWMVTIVIILLIRGRLSLESPMILRYVAICAAYLLALATSWVSLVYSLAGASPAWAVAGYILAILAVGVISLSRYAADVSPDR